MGIGIDGSKPIGDIKSAKRAMLIAEHEARKAGQRGDLESITNLRALVTYLANQVFEASSGSAILHIPGPESNFQGKKS